jgi:prepilin-type N-terminal cleavage/methylation domain-containing protein
MRRQTTGSRAFTLVELLAVITIIVLLVSLLVPLLTSARELARRAQCSANLHNIAAAGLGFAAMHDGRGPGNAERGWLGSTVSGSSMTWVEILNAEYYKSPTVVRGIWSWPLPKGLLTCPNIQLYNNRWYRCPYAWNSDAAGGDFMDANSGQWDTAHPLEVDPNFPHDTVYGKAVDPGSVPWSVQPYYTAMDKTYPTYNGTLAYYNLGARLTNFPNPSYTYLLIESDQWGGFSGYSGWATNPPATVINANARPGTVEGPNGEPPWDGAPGGGGDFYGFRHTRPSDYSVYQEKVTACFAFVDGHVDIMNANVPDQNKYQRFAFKP